MHHWIGLLQKPKGDSKIDGQEFIVRGESDRIFQNCTCCYIVVMMNHSTKRMLFVSFGITF